MKNELRSRECPFCGKAYSDYPAISRTMGKEAICPDCGTAQAITAYQISTAPMYQTRSVAEWAKDDNERISFLMDCCIRHIHFDWGEMDSEDIIANDRATVGVDRLFSSYNISVNIRGKPCYDKLWIITEADRSATTILFPDDY